MVGVAVGDMLLLTMNQRMVLENQVAASHCWANWFGVSLGPT